MAISPPNSEHYPFRKVSPDTAYELYESLRPFEKDYFLAPELCVSIGCLTMEGHLYAASRRHIESLRHKLMELLFQNIY